MSKIISFRNFKEIKKKTPEKIIETKKRNKTTSGTREWADSNENFQFGCKYGCLYCYALGMAKRRTNQPESHRKNLNDWKNNITIRKDQLQKGFGKRKGRIMIPTTHDIYPENLPYTKSILKKMLEKGNRVLITTKPDPDCIISICYDFEKYKDLIQFRFTITSKDDTILQFWEPHAPNYFNRLNSLAFAFYQGFKTSISIEPFLDPHPELIIRNLEKYITESIWLGTLNTRWVSENVRDMINSNPNPIIRDIFSYAKKGTLKEIVNRCEKVANGKLRLKDSIRNILEKDARKNEKRQ